MPDDLEPSDKSKDKTQSRLDTSIKVFERLVPLVSLLSVVFGGLLGLYKYLDTRHREVQLQEVAMEQSLLKEKQDTYLALCDAACAIATCENEAEVKAKAKDYLRLYLGKVHMLSNLDDDVVAKKIEFGHKLLGVLKVDKTTPYSQFSKPALELVDACRERLDLDRHALQARMAAGKAENGLAVNAGSASSTQADSSVDGS